MCGVGPQRMQMRIDENKKRAVAIQFNAQYTTQKMFHRNIQRQNSFVSEQIIIYKNKNKGRKRKEPNARMIDFFLF